MSNHSDDDEDDGPKLGAGMALKDWDCPECHANNPCDEKIGPKGVELRCNYCSIEFKATVNDEGRVKLKEM